MNDDPTKGASLSEVRSRAGRSVWERAREQSLSTPEVAVAPVVAKPVQLTLVPDAPPPPPKKKAVKPDKPPRPIAETTDAAVAAYNATLAIPHGLLPRVTQVGIVTRRAEVERAWAMASEICMQLYGSEDIPPKFWQQYFAQVARDDFLSGRTLGGEGHRNWKPSFEFLIRPKTMRRVWDEFETEQAKNERRNAAYSAAVHRG